MSIIIRSFISFSIITLTLSNLQAQIPDKFFNLKVLRTDISKRDLIETMKGATRGLGARCEFCHVGEGNDLSKFDFVSDDKKHKQIARMMFEMVKFINSEFMPRISKISEHQREIKCFTCHAGNENPLEHPKFRQKN